MTPNIHNLFLQSAPCCVLAREALEHLFEPTRLDELFHRSAELQYHRELFFSDILHLMLHVVLGLKPSVHAAYHDLKDQLGVSHQAVYAKLAGTDDSISEALLVDSANQIRPVIAALKAERPEPVPGFHARILDGNLLGRTERRLKPLRTSWSRGLPGRVLVVYEPACDLVTHAFLERDAHADERTRLADVLDLTSPDDLWIMDSHFCTHDILADIASNQAFFLVRQHGAMKGELVGKRRKVGRTDTGTVYEQQLKLGGRNEGWTIRRLTLVLDQPTTDGHTEIHVLTNVSESQTNAMVLMDAYRQRWTIEKRFYDVSQMFNAEPRTLAYPAAALFAFCLGLVASNAVALMQASLRSVHGPEVVDEMSNKKMAEEIRQTYRGMTIAFQLGSGSVLASTPEELAERLRRIASRIEPKRYRKSKRGPKKPVVRPGRYRPGVTHSTQRLLNAQKCGVNAP